MSRPVITPIRLSDVQAAELRAAASADHLPVSTWIRRAALLAAEAARAAGERADPELAAGTVITPQAPAGEPITYRAIEAAELRPSHDPWSFVPSPEYPTGVQEREYHRQPEEQAKVIQGAQRLDPRLLLTDTPSAVDGPPLVTGSWAHDGPPLVADGAARLVLGGNGRAMMILRAFRDPAALAAYKAALVRKAPAFGLERAAVRAMTAPVLVRVVSGISSESPRRELVAAVRRFNEGLTQALSTRARAVAEAGTLSPGALASIGALLEQSPDATMRELMRDRARELVSILRADGIITSRNSSELIAGGELTEAAKDRIEAMFLGRVLGSADRYAQTAPSVLGKLGRLVPSLVKVAAVNPDADAIPLVQGAIDMINDAERRGLTLDQLARQVDLLGAGPPPADRVRLAELVQTEGPVKLAARFRRWAELAALDPRQGTIFGAPPRPAELAAVLLG